MTPQELGKLERWQVETMYWNAEKLASALSRGCAKLQDDRDKFRAEVDSLTASEERLRAAGQQVLDTILAIDWIQVALNRSEPCCHMDPEWGMCGRANIWAGHPSQHKFISLYIAARAALTEEAK